MNNNQTQINQSAVNFLLLVDSYKHSHFMQQPTGSTGRFSYGGARGSKIRQINAVTFFGLQMFIKQYLMTVPTLADIAEAKEVCEAHGEPFAEKDFLEVNRLGHWPVTIRAVKEGTEVPVGNVMYTVEANHPGLEYLDAFIETQLLRAVWYPSSVATISKACKKIIKRFLDETCDNPEQEIGFKLHDFGARGVSSAESAGIGGLAHLVNFFGTDTMSALVYARRFYGTKMAGFSIPASEHSTITSWGMTDEGETAAYRNMLEKFGRPGSLFACVSDSRDILHAVENLWGGTLKDDVVKSGATLVIRPDSGDPTSTVLKVAMLLEKKFGYTVNNKGFRVLNNVRIIQGDGVDLDSIQSILYALKLNQISAENVAFGMGGALLQKVDRDTFSFAQKCSAIRINGEWKDVYKEAPGKASLRGRLVLVKGTVKELNHGVYGDKDSLVTRREEEAAALGLENQLELVYSYGKMYRDQTLDEIRAIAAL